ncbi:amidase family protein [Paenibacillus sp. GCM10012307]|uniref:Amidase n=1 Tax=Paenibacillus roseus TaxID=2798579 RepID=A0A934MK20_9BACL|nr:amidase family protein [Paenibacillus roseus]MBJ6360550.1 amidase [Paenibacillus roseus]
MNNKLLKSLLSVLIAATLFTGSGVVSSPYASAQQDSPVAQTPSDTSPQSGDTPEESIVEIPAPDASPEDNESAQRIADQLADTSPSVVVEGQKNLRFGEKLQVSIALKNIPDTVAAEKFVIQYNTSKLEFQEVKAAGSHIQIVGQQEAPGKITVITANPNSKLVSNQPIIIVSFKAKAAAGVDNVTVSAELGLSPDGEYGTAGSSTLDLEIEKGLIGDLNRNGKIEIGDLAKLVHYFDLTSVDPQWERIAEGDFNANLKIDLADLAILARKLLDKPFELIETTVADIHAAMQSGELTAEKLVSMYLKRIDNYDSQLHSILTVNSHALDIAREMDAEYKATGKLRGPLHGIPVIVKDNYNTVGMPTTAGCICLQNNFTTTDSFMIQKLKDAGAIILAKSNLHEFAFGTTTISSLGGQTNNPYDLSRNPGGSSGGTGAALAANLGAIGLGTDTGGSIRIPSSYNSLVGIRPTIGLTSREGIIPLALSQDVGGPMARTVADAALMLDVVSGYDKNDLATSYSIGRIPSSYTDYLDVNGLKGARIGVIRDSSVMGTNSEVIRLTNRAIAEMERMGATVVDVTVPNLAKILSYNSLSGTEFKFNLNDYLNSPSIGPDVTFKSLSDILATGTILESQRSSMVARNSIEVLETEAYKDILLYRTRTTQQSLLSTMADNKLDALLYPSTAAPVGGSAGSANRLSPFSGFPAISVPAGFASISGRPDSPIGIELLGKPFDEGTLIKLAYGFEQGTKYRVSPELFPALTN